MFKKTSPDKQSRPLLPPDLKRTLRRTRWKLLPASIPLLLSSALNVLLMLLIRESLAAALAGDPGRVRGVV